MTSDNHTHQVIIDNYGKAWGCSTRGFRPAGEWHVEFTGTAIEVNSFIAGWRARESFKSDTV